MTYVDLREIYGFSIKAPIIPKFYFFSTDKGRRLRANFFNESREYHPDITHNGKIKENRFS